MQNLFSKKFIIINLNLTILLLFLVWLSLFTFSTFNLEANAIFKILFSYPINDIQKSIILDIRLPRVLITLLCGSALACSGVVIQAITNNSLASPSILGINSGATLGMASLVVFTSSIGFLGTSIASFIGGAIAWFLVMLIGKSPYKQQSNLRLVLSGVAISAFCLALTKAIIILEEEQANGIMVWLAGSFADKSWLDFYYLLPFCIIGISVCFLLSPKLNLIVLGDEYAQSLGINPTKYRIIGSIVVLILVSSSISTVGSLAFIGLIVPHMARFIVGLDHRLFMITSALLGACLTVLADIICKAIVFPMETPAGAILALVGAPFFIYLVRRKI